VNSTPSLAFLAILMIALVANVALLMQPEPSLLYIQDGTSGSLALLENGEPEQYTLTLNGITPLSAYYSNDLNHLPGRIRTRNFIRIEGLFESVDPPEAVVILTDPNSDLGMNDVAVELRYPRYNPDLQQLSYDVVILDHATSPGLRAWQTELDAMLPESFGAVRIVIDRASFQLDNIQWTFVLSSESGEPMADVALTLDYTRLSGAVFSKTQLTNINGEVTFSLPSTFSVAALLTYSSDINSLDELSIYSIPITARCSGTFNLLFGDEPEEGQSLTLPCGVGN